VIPLLKVVVVDRFSSQQATVRMSAVVLEERFPSKLVAVTVTKPEI
jgi:hypothetical protein